MSSTPAVAIDLSSEVCPQSSHHHGHSHIAARLEKESEATASKRAALSQDDLDLKQKEADDRRQALLDSRVETAKELEGTKGEVAPDAEKESIPIGHKLERD